MALFPRAFASGCANIHDGDSEKMGGHAFSFKRASLMGLFARAVGTTGADGEVESAIVVGPEVVGRCYRG